MLSHTAEYALRAVLYLAERAAATPVQVGEIAHAVRVPHNYLSKILHVLARQGVLASTRGKRGGFRLATPPESLYLVQVVSPFGRLGETRHCLLGRPHCSDLTACSAHARWKDVAERVATFFRETTVAELLSGAPVAA